MSGPLNKGLVLKVGIILICSFLVYAGSLSNGFIYDDRESIIENAFIKDLTNLRHLFDQEYFRSEEASYRPVITATYIFDFVVWGANPFGYHLTNLLIHSINSFLLFVLLRHILKTGAFIAALIFLSHPLLSEAINGISFREDLLAFSFYFISLTLYLACLKRGEYRYLSYAASCFLFFLALLSKEMAVTLPLAMVLIDVYSGVKFTRPWRYVGYALVLLCYAYLRFFLFYNSMEQELIKAAPLSERLIQVPSLLGQYYRLLVLPINLTAEYPRKVALLWASVLGLSGLCVTVSTMLRIRRNPRFLGLFWILITLIPVFNVIPIINPVAERYIYLAMPGFSIILSSLLSCRLWSYKTLFTCIILVFYTILVTDRNSIWKDDILLWSDAARKTPNSSRAHLNLASVYLEKGMLSDALKENNIVLELNPLDPEAYANRGLTYAAMGEVEKAMADYKKALMIFPMLPNVHHNIGALYLKDGDRLRAVDEFTKELRVNPNKATIYKLYEAYISIGNEAFEKDDFPTAVERYHKAIEILREREEGYLNLALAYYKMGDKAGALRIYEELKSLRPGLAPVIDEKINRIKMVNRNR